MKYRYLSAPVVFFCFLLLFNSCTSYKHFSYFEDLPDTSKPVLATTVPFKEPVIANGDLLSITIQTIDNDVSALLNSSYSVNGGSTNAPVLGTSTTGNGAQAVPNGYLVDRNGAVTLPFVGAVQISGMTTAEAKDAVSREVNKYFNNEHDAKTVASGIEEMVNQRFQTEKERIATKMDIMELKGDISQVKMRMKQLFRDQMKLIILIMCGFALVIVSAMMMILTAT